MGAWGGPGPAPAPRPRDQIRLVTMPAGNSLAPSNRSLCIVTGMKRIHHRKGFTNIDTRGGDGHCATPKPSAPHLLKPQSENFFRLAHSSEKMRTERAQARFCCRLLRRARPRREPCGPAARTISIRATCLTAGPVTVKSRRSIAPTLP